MRFPLLLAIFPLCIIAWAPLCSSHGMSTSNGTIFDCLTNHSNPSYPISSVIFTPNNSLFSFVLQEYIQNRRFNNSYTRKPLFIVASTHVSHIQASILCAKEYGLQIRTRSGGHDYEGLSYVANVPFCILDMYNFRSIHVNIEEETVWVEAGATIGELYYAIANKSNVHGFPAGVCLTVGIGGYISGGGYGNMLRKYGLTVDNVIDAKLIDVNGRLLDRKSMGEDLFWAITGGGAPSFGVVLSYKINLLSVPAKITVFKVNKTHHQNLTYLIYRYQQVAHKLDNNLFIRLKLEVVTTRPGENTISATFIALFLGDTKTLLPIMNRTLPELGLTQDECIEMRWVESTLFFPGFPLGTSLDTLLSRDPKVLVYFKRKSDYLKTPMSIQAIELMFEKMVELRAPYLEYNPYGGRMAEIPSTAKPFPHRAGNIAKIMYATNWEEGGKKAAEYYLNLTKQLYEYMTPFVSKNPREAFLNYRDIDLGINHHNRWKSYFEGKSYGLKYYKGNYNRLVKVKTEVDPHNFFRNEQSIPTFPSLWK